MNDYDCFIEQRQDGSARLVCRLKDQQTAYLDDTTFSNIKDEAEQENTELYRLKHAASIAARENCDRVLT